MAENVDQHLTPDEIDDLVEGGCQVEDNAHLRSCPRCADGVRTGIRIRERLRAMEHSTIPDRGPKCLTAEEVARLANSETAGEEAARALDHISYCQRCGELLRSATETGADLTSDEAASLERLVTSTPEWQRKMARRFAGERRKRPRSGYIQGSIAAAVVIASGLLFWNQQRASDVDRLLSQAFIENRSFDLRLPGSGYGSIRQQRGPGNSTFDRSIALTEAEARIQRGLVNHPDDPRWLRRKGAAELIERQYQAAIDSLSRALEKDGANAELLTDLACGYAIRAELENRGMDYARAIDFLRKSEKINPGQPSTLFNLALLYEKTWNVEQSLREWNKLLEVEGSGGWSDEARRHIADLKSIKKKKSAFQVYQDPSGFLRFASGARSEFDVEPYLDVVWTKWLPEAKNNPLAHEAAVMAARRLVERSGDSSLEEALSASGRTRTNAFTLLAQAIEENQAGNADTADWLATQAAIGARAEASTAVAFRADVERLYALHRADRTKECLSLAARLRQQLANTSYVWAQGQTILEEASCLAQAGKFGPASDDLRGVIDSLRNRDLPLLTLRASGLLVSNDDHTGDFEEAWQQALVGLAGYWKSAAPPNRAHQFYLTMATSAHHCGLAQTAAAYSRAMVEFSERMGNQVNRALGRVDCAGLLVEARENEEAEAQLSTAIREFDALPPSPTVTRYRWNALLKRADLETVRNREDLALSEIRSLENESSPPDELLVQRLHRAKAAALLSEGKWELAESELIRAIDASRLSLQSFTSPADRLAFSTTIADMFRALSFIQLEKRHAEAKSLLTWEWFRSASTEVEPVALPERAFFQTRSLAAIVYAIQGERLAVWVADGEGVEGRLLPVPRIARDISVRFLGDCARPESRIEDIREEGAALYRWLLEPFADRLNRADSWVIIPDDWIASIPFGALTDGSGRYLTERKTILLGGSLSQIEKRYEPIAPIASMNALIVSTPNAALFSGAHLPFLGSADQEAHEVYAHFQQAKLLSGSASTVAAVQANAAPVDLFHFAGHGWTNAGNGGLLLAGPSGQALAQFTASDVRPADWSRCSLAVLSACMTGTGEGKGPSNPSSLVRALLTAGVLRVVAASWNLESSETRRFMKLFYDLLDRDASVAGALTKASRTLMTSVQTAHPYYWAGFQLYGTP